MVCIGYDRYNVIVKGMAGTRITYGMAVLMILCIWIYSTLICIPPFLGWGGYALGKFQGIMIKFRCFNLSQRVNYFMILQNRLGNIAETCLFFEKPCRKKDHNFLSI